MPSTSTLTFCEDYVAVAGSLLDLAYGFVLAALVAGIVYAGVEIYKKSKAPPPPGDRVAQSSLKDLIDALKGLIQALASAPAWIALFAFGLVLYAGAGMLVPETCEEEMNESYARAETDAERTSKPAANGPRSGDGTTSPSEKPDDK